MHHWATGMVLATALTFGAGTAQASLCPPSAELVFSDTVVIRGVVANVAWQSEEIQQVQYPRTAAAVPVTVQIWRATIEVTSVLRGERPQAPPMYDFQAPITGCQGPPVAIGDQVLMAINPSGVTTIESEAALAWASELRLTQRPSRPHASTQDREKQ